jgi:hypothetical protein
MWRAVQSQQSTSRRADGAGFAIKGHLHGANAPMSGTNAAEKSLGMASSVDSTLDCEKTLSPQIAG